MLSDRIVTKIQFSAKKITVSYNNILRIITEQEENKQLIWQDEKHLQMQFQRNSDIYECVDILVFSSRLSDWRQAAVVAAAPVTLSSWFLHSNLQLKVDLSRTLKR